MEARREVFTLDIGALTYQFSGDQRQHNEERIVHNMPSIFDSSTPSNKKASPLKEFLQSIFSLLKNDESLAELSEMVENCSKEPRRTATEAPKLLEIIVQHVAPQTEPMVEKSIKQVSQKNRTSQEFKINAQIREFDIDNIVLGLGSDVNVLPKRTWELM